MGLTVVLEESIRDIAREKKMGKKWKRDERTWNAE